MDDVCNGPLPRRGYFQQYLARMAPTPLPPPPLPLPASTHRPSHLLRGPSAGQKTKTETGRGKPKSAPTRKTLVDAFKQHGMKLCDGSKLNAVSKGVTHLGLIPPTLGVHITALYLSQNNLGGLDGIEQFKNVRLLSVAANLLVRFSSVVRLKELPQLRHLNLMGNPLCDHPNYRLRVVDALTQLAVLDTIEISRQEREIAAIVASQDRALREMVMKNHEEIQKLQRIAVWIQVLSELQCLVVRDAVTGRFDQLPNLQGGSVPSVDRFLRLWCMEDSMSSYKRDTLEAQMMAIVARTKSKLTEDTPQSMAKGMLLKLANVPLTTPQYRGNLGTPPAQIKREHSDWENAYAQVLQLQQQTIASLRGECERSQQGMVQSLRQLVIMNPYKRHHSNRENHSTTSVREPRLSSASTHKARRSLHEGANRGEGSPQAELTPASGDRSIQNTVTAERSVLGNTEGRNQPGSQQEESKAPRPLSLRRVLRSGDFGNKTLHEAIQSFSLREPVASKKPPSRHARPRTVQANASVMPVNYGNATVETPSDVRQSTITYAPGSLALMDGGDTREIAASETACSADTTYTPSVGWTSSDAQSEFDLAMNSPVVVASRAQFARGRDDVVHYRTRPFELMAVDEVEQFLQDAPVDEHVDHNERLKSADDPQTQPRCNSERQRELEEREEKYIAALMESEQRELDLRHQLSFMSKQIAQYQRMVSENERERLKVRAEINQRASAVARPTLLRRFFTKWTRFHELSHRHSQFQQRRQFIRQHDAFWCWRRQVWAQQELKRIQKRHQSRLLRCHLTEWANLTRISIIALHTQALRQSQLLQRILSEWRHRIYLKKLSRRMNYSKSEALSHRSLERVFGLWKQETAREAQTRRLHRFYGRHGDSVLKRVMFTHWKVYLLSIVRPLRTRVASAVALTRSKRRAQHFGAWKMVTKCERLSQFFFRKRIWNVWRGSIQRDRAERERLVSTRAERLRTHFMEWRGAAVEHAMSRRSLTLAMRHVNHRRMRKLWMYWKIYSIARKRHMQGVSKARKHFYIKLIRRSWSRWKQETRANLVSVKQKKRCELSTHFNAFRAGVRRLREEKKRSVFVRYAARRRQLARMRKAFTRWAGCTKRRTRCNVIRQVVSRQRAKALLCFVWSHWRGKRLARLKRRLDRCRQEVKSEELERKEAEKGLAMIGDQATSLKETVRLLNANVAEQASDIKAYQDEILHREGSALALEKRLAELETMINQSDAIHAEDLGKLEATNEVQRERITALESENAQLRRQLDDLMAQYEAGRCSTARVNEEKVSIEARLEELRTENAEFRQLAVVRERALCESVADLERRIEREQNEREETVRRLQEYEARIASTCAEIEDHEQAHEQECIRLRAENSRIDILRKEESVRNAELQSLLSEKNEQIIALSVRLQDSQWSKGVPQNASSNRKSKMKESRTQTEEVACSLKSTTTNENADADHMTVACPSPQPPPSSASQDTPPCPHFDGVYNCVVLLQQDSDPTTQTAVGKIVDVPKQIESLQPVPCEEERQIDEHTSQIHADIRLLQERINRRLQQIPSITDSEQLVRPLAARRLVFDKDDASMSTISESDQEKESRPTSRPSNVTSRPKSVSAPAKPRQRRVSSSIGRENLAHALNRPNSRADLSTRFVKSRLDPHPPRRPSGNSADTAKPKKRVGTRLYNKSGVTT